MSGIKNYLEEKLNNLSLKTKLLVFYLCCVLLPLFLTDSVIIYNVRRNEEVSLQREMENTADAVQSNLSYMFEQAVKMINNVYINRSVYEFLEEEYESALDFWEARQKMLDSYSFSSSSMDAGDVWMVVYGDNETILNGEHFYRISAAKETLWYQALEESGQDMILCFYYIGDSDPSATTQRKISLVRKMDYCKDLTNEKIIKLDLDYGTLVRNLISMNYSMSVYVCSGETILYSNNGHSDTKQDYEILSGDEKIGYELNWPIYGEDIRIIVIEPESTIFAFLQQNIVWILLITVANLLIPLFITFAINRSLTTRLHVLDTAFEEVNSESLKVIDDIRGRDEIGNLMRNYNRMVRKQQELIQTVYKDTLERQKISIARQKAELLALHSQINPHFLFNVLESFRMHCIIKHENETAEMIEELALLQRQNVDWSRDCIRVKEEITFVEAYLKLQKYRFGSRLSYKIEVESECEDLYIPRLTVTTFVENSLVHGIENKASDSWVFIRVYLINGIVCIEVEDTGAGMEENVVEELLQKLRACDMDDLMNEEHVGMINACLRMRMLTKENTTIELESEKGVGTFFRLKTPLDILLFFKRKGGRKKL